MSLSLTYFSLIKLVRKLLIATRASFSWGKSFSCGSYMFAQCAVPVL